MSEIIFNWFEWHFQWSMVVINVNVCSLCFNDVDFIIANYEAMREIFTIAFIYVHMWFVVHCFATPPTAIAMRKIYLYLPREIVNPSIIMTLFLDKFNNTNYLCSDAIQCRILHLRDLTLFIHYQAYFKNVFTKQKLRLILFLFNVVFFLILNSMKYSAQYLNLNECQSFFVWLRYINYSIIK